ncbi:MAG TPA: MBOAT family O-acyltransferase, partial [Cellvibrionaceae bacterium]
HSLSYCIDIYRRKFEPVHNLRDYLLYVGFFPQLVAGPIVRWSEMREQIETPRRMSATTIGMGVALMIVGLFEKVVLADSVFAPVADAYFNSAQSSSGAEAWVGALAFSGQIFCDFAGYTTCALGAALVLGFRLPINFLNPYAALGFSDFWRRWHISLSTWLRDYVYIGLGGNRRGRWFTYRNLMLTMLLGGLWHGAAWTFVVWGGLHGSLLIIERLIKNRLPHPIRLAWPLALLGKLATFAAIVITWVWFRSPDVASAWASSWQMLAFTSWVGAPVALSGAQQLVLLAMGLLLAGQLCFNNRSLPEVLAKIPAPLLGLLLGLLAAMIMLSPGESHAFIYFQF